jgi:hypothetical protein
MPEDYDLFVAARSDGRIQFGLVGQVEIIMSSDDALWLAGQILEAVNSTVEKHHICSLEEEKLVSIPMKES